VVLSPPAAGSPDPLTGLHGLAAFDAALASVEPGTRAALLCIDVDHFKSVNDAFGHARGDEVLAEVSARIASVLRAGDLAFRVGGDELVVLLPGVERGPATHAAERLLQAVREREVEGEPPLSIGLSIGVAVTPDDAAPADLRAVADARLYEAKRRGRGRVVASPPGEETRPRFEVDARLVERDSALTAIHRFLEAAERGPAALRIDGAPGTGRSRLLRETASAAGLRAWSVVLVPGTGVAEVEDACDRPGARVLLCVDDLDRLPEAVVERLARALGGRRSAEVAIAVVAGGDDAADRLARGRSVHAVAAEPLTAAATRVWLRSVLRREPGDELLEWLRARASGRPARIHALLHLLADRELLRPAGEGWELAPEFREVAAPGPATIPVPPAPLLGREGELAAVAALLAQHRLVTLCGPGGIGKTRLALELASTTRSAAGAAFVPLAGTGDPAGVPAAIAAALGLADGGDPATRCREYLRERELLLVLDNLEHLLSCAPLLTTLLESAAGVRILVTSRQRLGLRGEAVFEVGGLSLEASDDAAPPAVQLFLQRAGAAVRGFAPGDAERDAAERICREVGGMPLGIELAAAWVRVLSPAEIAVEIGRSLDFLAAEPGAVPERHRSLRAVFEHGWAALPEPARGVMASASVFRGGFRYPAARAVCGAEPAFLAALVDASFLRRAGERFEVHEVLRAFAAEKLAADPDAEAAARGRHCTWFVEQAAGCEPLLRGARQVDALAELLADLDNLRAAWEWAVSRRRADLLEPAFGGVARAMEMRSRLREAADLFAAAAAVSSGRTRALALVREGAFRARLGEMDLAERTLTEAETVLREEGGTAHALVLTSLGAVAGRRGLHEPARARMLEALELYRRAGDEDGEARATGGVGIIAYERGAYDEARPSFERALELTEAAGDAWSASRVLNNLANVALVRGRVAEARDTLTRSLALKRRIDDRDGIAATCINLGYTAMLEGALEEAEAHHSEALALSRATGAERGAALAFSNLGLVALARSDPRAAAAAFREGATRFRRAREPWGVAHCTAGLGRVALEEGDPEGAAGLLSEALRLRERVGDPGDTACATAWLATALVRAGSLDDAGDRIREAVRLALGSSSRRAGLEVALALVEYLAAAGEDAGAATLLRAVRADPHLDFPLRVAAGRCAAATGVAAAPGTEATDVPAFLAAWLERAAAAAPGEG
jgi:diguanylate cyclase (GGDEF)-like protein